MSHLVLHVRNLLVELTCVLVELILEEAPDLSLQPSLLRGNRHDQDTTVSHVHRAQFALKSYVTSQSSRLAAYELWINDRSQGLRAACCSAHQQDMESQWIVLRNMVGRASHRVAGVRVQDRVTLAADCGIDRALG